MNNKILIFVTLSSAALVACTQSTVDVAAEKAALSAAADAYHQAASNADVEALVPLHTNDAVILPPNAAAATGLQGVQDFANAFTAIPGFSIRFENVQVDVGAGGDMGYTLTDTVIKVDGPDGAPVENVSRDFHLWKKQDGAWKVAVDIWNTASPAAAAAATPMQGAWIVTSWTDAEGITNDEPQPALYVFTPTHYSIMIAQSAEARTRFGDIDEPTDSEKVGAYDTFIANSGRYEMDGNTFKTRAFVAKNPNYMGDRWDNEEVYEIERDGDTVTIKNDRGTGTFRQVEGTPNPWE
jgi:ketosteroid isomerase-like protein